MRLNKILKRADMDLFSPFSALTEIECRAKVLSSLPHGWRTKVSRSQLIHVTVKHGNQTWLCGVFQSWAHLLHFRNAVQSQNIAGYSN